MDIENLYAKFTESAGITTDSRHIGERQMFVALKGENFDGNEYALKALEAGALYAVVNEDSEAARSGNESVIPVKDTLLALQALARHHRQSVLVNGKPLTVLALTGTNGKTTTKELIRQVLGTKYRITATNGNLNNNIGVPLTLLGIDASTELAVVEMGASHPGDIEELVNIALPDYGLVTNVGRAHLLGFGSLEGVMKTKGELYDFVNAHGGKAFVNTDNPLLCQMAAGRQGLQTIPYGLGLRQAEILETTAENPFLRLSVPYDGKNIVVETSLVGSYNADNVMAAIAVGEFFGVSLPEAVEAISEYVPSNNRSQMTRTDRNTLIVDAYNANPTSMEAALGNFHSVNADRKIAMLGDMLELGGESENEHIKIVEKAMSMSLARVYLVGQEFGKAVKSLFGEESRMPENMEWFADSAQLASRLQKTAPEGAVILIKGSRGSRMENVLSAL